MTDPRTTRRNGSGIRGFLSSPLAWDGVLALVTALPALAFISLFFPGRANVDIANQYRQATGDIPFSDWHPPVMSAVWRMLIGITGQAGSLFVLQVAMLALACWLIGVLVHRLGGSRLVSLAGPAIMATPWVVSQMTTMWKDTQMAVAILLAAVLLTITRFVPKTWILWLPALVLLVYAFGLRKNALFAIVPIAVYFGYVIVKRLAGSSRVSDGGRLSRVTARTGVATTVASLLILVVLGAGVKATDVAIASREDVKPTGQLSQVFLDDVMFSVPNGELQDSDAPAALKKKISTSRDKCLEMGEIWDAYWNCYGLGKTGKPFEPIAYQDELKDLCLSEVITHPLRYAEYRTAVFSYYFFSSKVEYWPAEWHGEALKAGIDDGSAKADYIVRPYVEDFALDTFPMLFKPWFWTLLAAIALGLAYRAHRRGGNAFDVPVQAWSLWPEITMLSASALCYIFGYFPIVPASHFRYTFWPALAVTAALALLLTTWRRDRAVATPRSSASSKSET